jgi:hypothetical protein
VTAEAEQDDKDMKIKRWALMTVGLYAVSLLILTLPVILLCFSPQGTEKFTPHEAFSLYLEPSYWGFIAALMLVQSVFLFIPLQIVRERPLRRRSWWWLAILAALMMGLLVLAMAVAVCTALWLDDGGKNAGWTCVALGVAGWIIWAIIFAHFARSNPATAFSRIMKTMLVGSVTELLVAIPCHVYVRQKDQCCADFATFIGIVTGLSVLLFALGPGVFLLFVKRSRELRKAVGDEAPASESSEKFLTGFTRRAFLWALGALLLALIPTALLFAPAMNRPEVWVVCRGG